MKLSIWQQFSANHSSNFTIIGKFESVEEAQQIADQFEQIFAAIVDAKIADGYYSNEGGNPTAFEKSLWEKYQVSAWAESFDWLGNRDIKVWNTYLVITNDRFGFDVTHQSPQPIIEIMQQFSKVVFYESEWGNRLTFNLTGTAQSEGIARSIEGKMHALLSLEHFLEQRNPYDIERKNPPHILSAMEHGDYEKAKALQAEIDNIPVIRQRLEDEAHVEPYLPIELSWSSITYPHFKSDHEWGVERNGNTLYLYDVDFAGIEHLKTLISWLGEKGFSDIQVTFKDLRGDET